MVQQEEESWVIARCNSRGKMTKEVKNVRLGTSGQECGKEHGEGSAGSRAARELEHEFKLTALGSPVVPLWRQGRWLARGQTEASVERAGENADSETTQDKLMVLRQKPQAEERCGWAALRGLCDRSPRRPTLRRSPLSISWTSG